MQAKVSEPIETGDEVKALVEIINRRLGGQNKDIVTLGEIPQLVALLVGLTGRRDYLNID